MSIPFACASHPRPRGLHSAGRAPPSTTTLRPQDGRPLHPPGRGHRPEAQRPRARGRDDGGSAGSASRGTRARCRGPPAPTAERAPAIYREHARSAHRERACLSLLLAARAPREVRKRQIALKLKPATTAPAALAPEESAAARGRRVACRPASRPPRHDDGPRLPARGDRSEHTSTTRSSSSPTASRYHLAAIVDDHLMGITHVFRGVEWLGPSLCTRS